MIEIGATVIEKASGDRWVVVSVPSLDKVVCAKTKVDLSEPFSESFWRNASNSAYREFSLNEVQADS